MCTTGADLKAQLTDGELLQRVAPKCSYTALAVAATAAATVRCAADVAQAASSCCSGAASSCCAAAIKCMAVTISPVDQSLPALQELNTSHEL
jgi:urease accessory protein UreF